MICGSLTIKPTKLVGIILLYYSLYSVGLSKPNVDRILSTNIEIKRSTSTPTEVSILRECKCSRDGSISSVRLEKYATGSPKVRLLAMSTSTYAGSQVIISGSKAADRQSGSCI